ncbi:MAG: hypothetical protein PSN34_06500 [Urechidicola sp.]|nr:hypothetical protein [Urechidicola sp.]
MEKISCIIILAIHFMGFGQSEHDTLILKENENPILNIIEIKDSLKFTSNLENDKILMLDSLFKNFIEELNNNDFSIPKNYMSDLIVNKIKDDKQDYLKELLSSENKLKITYYGIQMYPENKVFKILHYTYILETDNPKFEKIKIIFDDEDKIYAIKPIYYTKFYKAN